MLVVISPAKRLDWSETEAPESEPAFANEAATLAGHMRQLPLEKMRRLMDLSDDLARLNRDRFRRFAREPDPAETRPAVRAFAGDTYAGLDSGSLDEDAMRWAQSHLRILSGLYGVLRPLDAIQPYRLEMGSRLKTRRGASLYAFWGDRLAKALSEAARAVGSETLLNCSSQEYFSAVPAAALDLRVVTPVFLEARGGAEPRIVSFFAKKARGAMARFVIENRLTDPAALTAFDAGGYRHDPERSSPDRPVFVRAEPAEAG